MRRTALAICGAQMRDGAPWSDLLDALVKADLEYIDREQRSVKKSLKVSVDRLAPLEAACYRDLAVLSPRRDHLRGGYCMTSG